MERSVLIVDDNILTVRALAQTIPWAQLGYAVAGTAGNGEDGLRMIEVHRPDLVISDIKMPGMSGLEMLHRASRDGMQVIFITGYQEFEWAREAVKLGAVDFILKPVDDAELIRAVHKASARMAAPIAPEEQQAAPGPAQKLSFLVKNVLAYLQEHYCEDLTLQTLAEVFYVHPAYLSTVVKKETGRNFIHILTDLRMEKAKKLLRDPMVPIKDVSFACGFHDYAYFYQAFKKSVGQAPGEYRAEVQSGAGNFNEKSKP